VEVEDACQHRRVGLVERAVCAGLHNEKPELLRRMHVMRVRLRADAETAQQHIRRTVQHVDRRCHHPREHDERHDQVPAHALGFDERDGLWRELAQDDVQEGDDDERGRGASDRVDGGGRRLDAEQAEESVHEARQRRLADPAKP
jgi:hypothetical protein